MLLAFQKRAHKKDIKTCYHGHQIIAEAIFLITKIEQWLLSKSCITDH